MQSGIEVGIKYRVQIIILKIFFIHLKRGVHTSNDPFTKRTELLG